MLIYRKVKFLSYKYYKTKAFLGESKNRLLVRKIIYDKYRISIKSYINYIFLTAIVFTVLYIKNMQFLFLLFIIIFLIRLVFSLFDTSKITDDNNNFIGTMKHVTFSNTIEFVLYGDKYEVYSHGGNVFSVIKNNFQIALIKTNGKIIANELCFEVDCLNDYRDLLPLFVICTDCKFYSYILGRRNNLIYFPMNTYNWYDKHRERTLWKSED